MKILPRLKDLYLTTRPKPWKIEKPVTLQFPVNDICDSRCQMCNIWRQKLDYQIEPYELAKVLSSTLFSEIRTVGVNGGEPTLRKDLPELVSILFEKLPKLSMVALITNGLNSQRVIRNIREVGQVVKSHNGHLSVMVSLDGVGEVHDGVRGREGHFKNAVKVIDFIQSSDLVFNFTLGCTVIKENIYNIDDLLEFTLKKNIYITFRIGIPHQRLYTLDMTEPYDLSFKEKYHFAIFLENLIKHYEKSNLQKFFYQSLIGQLIYGNPRIAGCYWQHKAATLSSRGELLYCAVRSKVLGSAITHDPQHLYMGNKAYLYDIVRSECDSCMHDYVGLPSTEVFLNSYMEKALDRVGISSQSVKEAKVLKPLKLVKRRRDFNKRMKAAGVNLSGQPGLQPTVQFPKDRAVNRKVLICGWYGTETLGDKAILGGVVISLKKVWPDIELHVASLEPYISKMTVCQMPELKDCTLHPIYNAIDLASSMDLVVFGGGPLMAIGALAEMLAIFQRAVEARVPTLIAGCGIGPLGAAYHNKAIKSLLLNASHRIYRDQESLEAAKSLNINIAADQVAEDPSFTWINNHETIKDADGSQEGFKKIPKLLLGLRDWPYQNFAPELTFFEAEKIKIRFKKEVILALELLLENYPNLKIVPFPMCTNHLGNDDRWYYRELFRGNTTLQKALDLTYLGPELNPAEAITVFKSASAALAMRYHSLVFALATGLPVIAVDYTLREGKVHFLAKKYQVPHLGLDRITHEFIYSVLTDIFKDDKKDSISSKHHIPLSFESSIGSFISTI